MFQQQYLFVMFPLLLLGVLFFHHNESEKNSFVLETEQKEPISTELNVVQNLIVNKDTGEPVVLVGAVSDQFRYGRNHDPLYEDIAGEFNAIRTLQKIGINTIGLYMSDFNEIKKNIDVLDAYVSFTGNNGIYLYLMPVAREFKEGYYPVSWSPEPEDTKDLTLLINFLAERYKNNKHIIYGFGAEPDFPSSGFDYWYEKQIELATIVREHNPNALLFVSGVAQYSLSQFLENPFPFNNVVYMAGGYLSENDEDYERRLTSAEVLEDLIQKKLNTNQTLSAQYPIIFSEFGGNVSENFSSEKDILMIKKYVAALDSSDISYTAYRLMPRYPDDKLSLFDREGIPTSRGEAFFASLKKF